MIHSFLSLGSKNVLKKNEKKATGAKIHAPVLGQNYLKSAIVGRGRVAVFFLRLSILKAGNFKAL